jgi:hypothetical protein
LEYRSSIDTTWSASRYKAFAENHAAAAAAVVLNEKYVKLKGKVSINTGAGDAQRSATSPNIQRAVARYREVS